MVISTSTASINIYSTKPTPVHSAIAAVHSIASAIFLNSDPTTRTICCINIHRRPNLKTDGPRNLASALMPLVTAFKTNLLAADTHSLIFAATRFFHCVFAVRSWTPFKTFILSNLQFLFYLFVFALDLFGTKKLNLINSKLLSTHLLRA